MITNIYIKRTICFLISFLMVLTINFGIKNDTYAEEFEKVEITLNLDVPVTITNAEGETIIVDSEGKISGTMEILKEKYEMETPNVYKVLLVRSSDSYVLDRKSKGYNHLVIDYINKKDSMVIVDTNDSCHAEINMSKKELSLSGKKQQYFISLCMGEALGGYELDGTLYKPITLKNEQNQMIVNGAQGKTKITVISADDKDTLDGLYYLFGDKTVMGYNESGAFIKNAAKLETKEAKKPKCLYVRPVNKNKNMFLTWTKVKKARSYIVYKRDNSSGKYKKVAIRNGKGTNYYVTEIKDDNVYAYKVLAKTKKNGKGKKIRKRSYGVKAVSLTNKCGNAQSVVVDKKSLSIKRGRRKTLKAKIIQTEKPLLDKKIRWYSSNKKIAKINKKTGKVLAVKKGSCKIWAKAHNGKNSKKIVVKVK
ncbi:MAG: fibronectin type III domain-containing protein [Eubacterium sp.]|nr:fibronectin type III domain-containing protein [Eubacterium sp.]